MYFCIYRKKARMNLIDEQPKYTEYKQMYTKLYEYYKTTIAKYDFSVYESSHAELLYKRISFYLILFEQPTFNVYLL